MAKNKMNNLFVKGKKTALMVLLVLFFSSCSLDWMYKLLDDQYETSGEVFSGIKFEDQGNALLGAFGTIIFGLFTCAFFSAHPDNKKKRSVSKAHTCTYKNNKKIISIKKDFLSDTKKTKRTYAKKSQTNIFGTRVVFEYKSGRRR